MAVNEYVNKVVYGSSTLIDLTGDDVQESDVRAGVKFHLPSGEPATGTGSGGGASNHITGTFTGSIGGTGQSVSVPYSGSGYPVAVMIYPSSGTQKSGAAITTLVQPYAIIAYCAVKEDMSLAPTYNSNDFAENNVSVFAFYKGSSSDPTSTNANRILNAFFYTSWPVNDGLDAVIRFPNSTTMNAYIKASNGGDYYGFARGIEYTYQVVYSE